MAREESPVCEEKTTTVIQNQALHFPVTPTPFSPGKGRAGMAARRPPSWGSAALLLGSGRRFLRRWLEACIV